MESGRDVGEVKPQKGKCICAWRNCDDIKKQFCANLPDNHVWNGPLIQVKKGLNAEEKKSPRGMSSMFKNMAFRAGIYHHLKVPRDQQTDSKFRVARHHFPQILLKEYTLRSALLSAEQARALDQKSLSTNLSEQLQPVNTAISLLNTTSINLTDEEKEIYAEKYVQVPAVSIEDDMSLVTSFNTT